MEEKSNDVLAKTFGVWNRKESVVETVENGRLEFSKHWKKNEPQKSAKGAKKRKHACREDTDRITG